MKNHNSRDCDQMFGTVDSLHKQHEKPRYWAQNKHRPVELGHSQLRVHKHNLSLPAIGHLKLPPLEHTKQFFGPLVMKDMDSLGFLATKDSEKRHSLLIANENEYNFLCINDNGLTLLLLLFERPTSYVMERSGLKSPKARSEPGPGFKSSSYKANRYVSTDFPGINGVPTIDLRWAMRFPLKALAFSTLGATSLLSPL